MSENSAIRSHPGGNPTNPHNLPRESSVGFSSTSQDHQALTRKTTRGWWEKEERKGDESEEMKRLRRDVESLKGLLNRERAETSRLRGVEEKLIATCKRRDDRIAKQHQDIRRASSLHQDTLEEHAKQTRAMEERLKQTAELLAARSAELSETRTFLSTTDRLSEAEVLSIVRDLNEKIFQIAVNLTEVWEKLEPSQERGRTDVDPSFPLRGSAPALVQLTRNRDLTGLTFLLQSCLCSQAAEMTSSWGYDRELATLKSVYGRLSASEGQAISARWRALAHSYLSRSPPHPGPLVEQLARALYETGSFSSPQHSAEFVQATALEGIESMVQLSTRLEHTFMVEVTSGDMFLLFESPDTMFCRKMMTNEFGTDSVSPSGKGEKIAGTTEVGVGKSVSGGAGEARRVEILLKTKVVLEKDVVGNQ